MNSILLACAIVGTFPHWIDVPSIRDVPSQSACVRDVESRLPYNNPYYDSDPITWVHEGTHGINSLLRQKHGKPCFYLLGGKALTCDEPVGSLIHVAYNTPNCLRGEIYQLYLIHAQKWWNKQPTYLMDELSAYLNGATCWKELKLRTRHETVEYAYEMAAYCFVMLQTCSVRVGEASEAVKEMIHRLTLIESPVRDKTMIQLRTNPDCEQLRKYLRQLYTPHWTAQYLGF